MKFIQFKKELKESLIRLCEDKIRERGGTPGQVVVIDSTDHTSIKVKGTITETITVPVQLSGPVTALDDLEIKNV